MASRESTIANRYIAIAATLITLAVSTDIGPDPVNLPKLTLLTIFSFYFFGLSISSLKNRILEKKNIFFIIFLPITALLLNLIFGSNSFTDNFYGAFARNTGVLAYISLFLMSVSFVTLANSNGVKNLINWFFIAGLINLIYGVIFVFSGHDLIPWNNMYGKFLGTVGNPDFCSALMGMCFAAALGIILINGFKSLKGTTAAISLPFFLFLSYETKALQGLIVIVFAFVIFILYKLYTNQNTKRFFSPSFILVLFSSILGILGTLQIGPLTQFLYKPTVSVRGAYWRAALEMFYQHPVFGIGLDSYGDWYRRARDARALEVPGISVTADAAHNVFLDLLAGGGLILFIPYISLIIYIFLTTIKKFRYSDPENNLRFALFLIWSAYILQSLVSINQIGLAIWGWLSGAGLVFLNKRSKTSEESKLIKKKSEISEVSLVTSILFLFIGCSLILPKQISEAKWLAAVRTKNVANIMIASEAWPRNCGRYLSTYQVLPSGKFAEEAKTSLEKCLNINPNSFPALEALSKFNLSTAELHKIRERLHTLDPLNPSYS